MGKFKSTILITGINGFLGSSLAKKLSETYNIVGLDVMNSNNFRLAGNNFETYFSSDPLDTIFTDQVVDYIIHTATLFGRDNETSSDLIYNNLLIPIKLAEKAKQYRTQAFLNTHTSLPYNTNSYSLSKRQFLDWLLLFQNNMQIVNIVPEHFYGPGANDSNFITGITIKMLANIPFIDLTLGEQRRDFVYIDDLVDAYCLIISKLSSLSQYSEFEIGSGEINSIKDVVLKVHELAKSNTIPKFGAIPYRENEFMQSESDISNICSLGWKPQVNLETGLKKTIEYYKSKL